MEDQKIKRLCYVGIALLLVLIARRCDKPHSIDILSAKKAGEKIPAAFVLKPEEKEKVIVDTDHRRVTIVTPQKIETFSGVRHATIIDKKDGTVEVIAKQYGWCFEPALGVSVSDHVGVTTDFQFAFWNHYGLTFGARLWPAPVPFLAVSYELVALRLLNTSVFAGIDWRHYPCVGVRVRV